MNVRKALTPALNSIIAWMSARRHGLRLIGLFAALLLFAGGLYLALTEVPNLASRIHFGPLLLLLLLGPIVTITHSATEFCLTARAAGNAIKWRTALEITILANAANMLPLPGGVLTRVAALRAHGSGFGRGSAAVLFFGFIWGGLAFLYSAIALGFQNHVALASAFAAIGFLMLGTSAIGLSRMRAHYSLPLLAGLMRLASLPIETLRLMLAAWGVGAWIDFDQAAVLVVSSFLGLAVSIVPAGLGVREAVIAALSPFIGLPPAIGFLAGVAGRIVYMLGQSLAVLLVLLTSKSKPSEIEFPEGRVGEQESAKGTP